MEREPAAQSLPRRLLARRWCLPTDAILALLLRVLQALPRRWILPDTAVMKRLNADGIEIEHGDIVDVHLESLVVEVPNVISRIREFLLVPHFNNSLRWEAKSAKPTAVTTMSYKDLIATTEAIPKQPYHNTFRVPTHGVD